MEKAAVLEAVKAAFEAPVGPAKPACGCGRAYVCVSGDRATVNAVAAAAKKVGVTFLRKAYGTSGNAFYCGYDNADGRALAKAEAVAGVLKAKGLSAYVDAVAD
jgi:hypothetical protein